MKYTLLELTQDILSSMDSDEINSINDTVESQQVVKVIKTVYDDLISRGDLTSNKMLFNLSPSNTLQRPVVMYKPENIDRIDWVKYNKFTSYSSDPAWDYVEYLPIVQFIEYVQQFNTSDPEVKTFTYVDKGFAFDINYKNNIAPRFYSTFDDKTLIFDSYDTDVDDTLQASKTLCNGFLNTEWKEEDSFVPNLQPQQYALLLNEAKSLAWAELRQTVHTKAETSARRNWRHLQKTRHNSPSANFFNAEHPFNKLRNFGRIK